MGFSCVLYVAVVDDDFVAFVDGDAVRGESVMWDTPSVLVKGQGIVEEVEGSSGWCLVVNRVSDAYSDGGTCSDRDYANCEQ